jgi:hypothetical protein
MGEYLTGFYRIDGGEGLWAAFILLRTGTGGHAVVNMTMYKCWIFLEHLSKC